MMERGRLRLWRSPQGMHRTGETPRETGIANRRQFLYDFDPISKIQSLEWVDLTNANPSSGAESSETELRRVLLH